MRTALCPFQLAEIHFELVMIQLVRPEYVRAQLWPAPNLLLQAELYALGL